MNPEIQVDGNKDKNLKSCKRTLSIRLAQVCSKKYHTMGISKPHHLLQFNLLASQEEREGEEEVTRKRKNEDFAEVRSRGKRMKKVEVAKEGNVEIENEDNEEETEKNFPLSTNREREMEGAEEHDIVIVGGGISGLATALALHRNRKGIKSVVLERADSLRIEGGAIGILANGWRALDQLGLSVSNHLRQKAALNQRSFVISLDNGTQKEVPLGVGEGRCVKRGDLINALADALPFGTIHFGCSVISVELDSSVNSFPILHLLGGKTIIAKIVIGCDGGRSEIGKFVGLKPTRQFSHSAVRGLTSYPKGHTFKHEFIRWKKNDSSVLTGRIPIDEKYVYWFVAFKSSSSQAEETWKDDQELVREKTTELLSVNKFPKEVIEMINKSEVESISFTHRLKYRAPWDLVFGSFRKGTITVAGDALHVMGPFLGQGGSAGLEDAIVLARRLSKAGLGGEMDDEMMKKRVGEAMDDYIKERRIRLVGLSTQTYLTGMLIQGPQLFVKIFIILVMNVLFRDARGHSKYDCGQL
ncbi:monooxygenase 1-like [Impatiens glandulifera]|uniref:monooxygenase 1-like n=1 Tax=Impatiens glandulifera TaxID=253017 RepID=UPI001FB07D8A|nr:monooxygenase 1-like [Impatiens glandulifera]